MTEDDYDGKYIATSRQMSEEELKKKNDDVATRYYGKDITGIYQKFDVKKEK